MYLFFAFSIFVFLLRILTTAESEERVKNWWRERIESMTGNEKENQIEQIFGSRAVYEEQCLRGKNRRALQSSKIIEVQKAEELCR